GLQPDGLSPRRRSHRSRQTDGNSVGSRDLWHNPGSAGRQADRFDGRPADDGRLSEDSRGGERGPASAGTAQTGRPAAFQTDLPGARARAVARPRAGDHYYSRGGGKTFHAMMRTLDLNCDMGEAFGAWHMGEDAALLDHVTSANIACGFHAGDPGTIHRTVKMAIEKGVAVGAHPSLPDLQGFGRRAIAIAPAEAYDMVLYQIGAVAAFARSLGGRLSHVKAHGALYNMAARDGSLARAIAKAVKDFDPRLVLFGLAGSELVRAGHEAGLR